jgi:hypothetical protein
MADKHSREPIKHTCPDIDKYINWIKFEIMDKSIFEKLNGNFAKPLLCAGRVISTKFNLKTE